MTMKKFEGWFNDFKNEDPEKNLWYVLMEPFMEIAWEAALLESAKAEPPEPVQQIDGREFTILLRKTISTLIGIYVPGAIKEDPQHILVSQICAKAREACDLLDAQAERIEKLCVENGILWGKNKAQAERIEKLEKAIRKCLDAWRFVDGSLEKDWLGQALQS